MEQNLQRSTCVCKWNDKSPLFLVAEIETRWSLVPLHAHATIEILIAQAGRPEESDCMRVLTTVLWKSADMVLTARNYACNKCVHRRQRASEFRIPLLHARNIPSVELLKFDYCHKPWPTFHRSLHSEAPFVLCLHFVFVLSTMP